MKIAAVIVTHNRFELLKRALWSYENQDVLPDYLIVVDNMCSDGTAEYLKTWKEKSKNNCHKIVITMNDNVGGSGGFYVGTKAALDLKVDWIWVADDDAIPERDVFSKAKRHIKEIRFDKVVAICTSVYVDGKVSTSNRGIRKKNPLRFTLHEIDEERYSDDYFLCNHFSYVGVLMRADILEEVGLINKDFFIWRDDVEHSWRLSEKGIIVCFPDMRVNHYISKNDYSGTTWKSYYGYRNDIILLKDKKKYIYMLTKIAAAIRKSILSNSREERFLYISAIKNGLKGEKGMNDLYNPTWSVNNREC